MHQNNCCNGFLGGDKFGKLFLSLLVGNRWIDYFDFYFYVCDDTLVQESPLIALVLKPNAQIVDYLFEKLNLLVPFPCHEFFSLLLFASSRWKSCFRALSGKPTQNVHGNSSFGWVELKRILLFFLISGIFPRNVTRRRE